MQTQILGLVTPLMALLFAVSFYIIWRVGKLGRHVLGFAIAHVLFACGFLVTHLLPPTAIYVFHATQAFYAMGAIVLLSAVCERVGQRAPIRSMLVVYVLTAAGMGLAVALTSDVGPRLILGNIGYGVMFTIGATVLITGRRREPIDVAIIVLMAVQAADFLIRPTITIIFERTIDAAVYRESLYYSLIGLVLGLKATATAMVLFFASIVEWTGSLRERGDRDMLTGLRNRGAFEKAMLTMLPRAQAENRALSLVVADIDHFKQVNDIWGHQAGDQAIAAFGQLIEETVRGCDIAGRIGGEEFCIAVWNCENEPAERLAERIRVAFAQLPHTEITGDVRLTASLGVATARVGESYSRLFARADSALYRAKEAGRNRVENAERPSGNIATAPAPAAAEVKVERLREAQAN